MTGEFVAPFRWNVACPEGLGSLLHGPPANAYAEFSDDLRECCARVIAESNGHDLVFVGRSPESLFDYLNGALGDCPSGNLVRMMHFSMRGCSYRELAKDQPEAIARMRTYLAHLGLEPRRMLAAPPVAIVDLVCTGGTVSRLLEILWRWAEEAGCSHKSIRDKLRVIAITERVYRTRPGDGWKSSGWVAWLGLERVREVAAIERLWRYLGDNQPKVTDSYRFEGWGRLRAHSREEERLQALRFAARLTQWARTRQEQVRLAAELMRWGGDNDEQVHTLAGELREGARRGRRRDGSCRSPPAIRKGWRGGAHEFTARTDETGRREGELDFFGFNVAEGVGEGEERASGPPFRLGRPNLANHFAFMSQN